VKQLGWDPQPVQLASTRYDLRARLKMSTPFTLVGLASSGVFLATCVLVVGGRPRSTRRLILGMEYPIFPTTVSLAYQQLLFAGFSGGVITTLSMLRRSSLPRRLDDFLLDDGDATDQEILRRFALSLEIQGSADGQLDVAV
jgi:hypothetical protein